MSVPVVSVVGWANSGKTTFLEKLIAELKSRGYNVGIIKHHHDNVELDRPGKDTYRHAQAGADAVIIASPQKIGVVRKTSDEWPLEKLVELLTDMDIVITEGYKRAATAKLEIYRQGVSPGPAADDKHLLAVISDGDLNRDVPVYNWNDARGVADLLETKLLRC
ncbi:molybdopterin-guanine dinucleotide biosynthesis protein B [Peptococcaceae bacterium 1198_IL3148]